MKSGVHFFRPSKQLSEARVVFWARSHRIIVCALNSPEPQLLWMKTLLHSYASYDRCRFRRQRGELNPSSFVDEENCRSTTEVLAHCPAPSTRSGRGPDIEEHRRLISAHPQSTRNVCNPSLVSFGLHTGLHTNNDTARFSRHDFR